MVLEGHDAFEIGYVPIATRQELKAQATVR